MISRALNARKRKIFALFFALAASIGLSWADTEVTITQNDFPQNGQSFTKDGVTVSAGMIDGTEGNLMGGGSFSTTLGNFTKIEVTTGFCGVLSGTGWSGDSQKKTWTGNASSVSFSGEIMGMGMGTTLKFTIEPASTPEPEPAGEVTVVFAANNNTVERTVTLPHTFSCSYENKNGELDAIIKELYEISAGHCSDDNYPVASGNEAVLAGSNGFDNYITISAAFEGTATVSGWYWNSDAYDGDGDWMDYTLTISIKGGGSAPATTVVTITNNDFPGMDVSFTKDGVTVSADWIDNMDSGHLVAPGSFSTTLGNFTKIEVNAGEIGSLGEGWSGNSERQTWTGNASSVSFSGDIMGLGHGITIMCTIEAASTPEPEPQGETITVTWNSYDLPSSGSSFTKDGVTLTCDIDDDLYGPGTFTTDLGNFTQIVVSGDGACYIDATDGWSGNYDQKTWTGNAAIVPFDGSIYAFSSDVTFVFTIKPSGGETAVDNIQIDKAQSTKLIRNGMLLIERNGKLYNATGAEVK